MTEGGLYALLRSRMSAEEVGVGEAVAVAELHKRLLPYHTCRDRLGYATKAEYDAAVLRLLADDGLVMVQEPALREAVRSEIRQAEPGLGFLHKFAASEIRLRDAVVADVPPPAEPSRSSSAESADCRACGAGLPDVSGARYCPSCGADQTIPTCVGCGAEIEDTWQFCAYCGSSQDDERC